mgnify:CR=1 FL=1
MGEVKWVKYSLGKGGVGEDFFEEGKRDDILNGLGFNLRGVMGESIVLGVVGCVWVFC